MVDFFTEIPKMANFFYYKMRGKLIHGVGLYTENTVVTHNGES